MTSLLMSSAPISISHRRFRSWIQIPETHLLLQALLPFPAPPPERPVELTRRLIQVYNWEFNSCTSQYQLFVAMAVLLFNILKHLHYLDSKQTSRALKLLTIIASSKRIRIP